MGEKQNNNNQQTNKQKLPTQMHAQIFARATQNGFTRHSAVTRFSKQYSIRSSIPLVKKERKNNLWRLTPAPHKQKVGRQAD